MKTNNISINNVLRIVVELMVTITYIFLINIILVMVIDNQGYQWGVSDDGHLILLSLYFTVIFIFIAFLLLIARKTKWGDRYRYFPDLFLFIVPYCLCYYVLTQCTYLHPGRYLEILANVLPIIVAYCCYKIFYMFKKRSVFAGVLYYIIFLIIVIVSLGIKQVGLNYFEKGKNYFQGLHLLQPQSKAYYRAINCFKIAKLCGVNKEDSLLFIAESYYNVKEYGIAMQYFLKVLEKDGSKAEAHSGIIDCMIQLNLMREAERKATELIFQTNMQELAYSSLARIAGINEKKDDAIKYFRKTLEINKNNKYAAEGLTSELCDEKRFVEAEDVVIKYLKNLIEVDIWHLKLAQIDIAKGDYKKARENTYASMKIIEMRDYCGFQYNNISNKMLLAKVLYELGEYKKAIWFLKQVKISDPAHEGLLVALAEAYKALGEKRQTK